jgi:hypothetical protein
LPAAGTVCDADLKPLLGNPGKIEEDHSIRSVDDAALYKALLEEAQRFSGHFPL